MDVVPIISKYVFKYFEIYRISPSLVPVEFHKYESTLLKIKELLLGNENIFENELFNQLPLEIKLILTNYYDNIQK